MTNESAAPLRRLRVLVVLPLYGGSLPVGRFCVRALEELGHVVSVFEAPEFNSAYTALKGLNVAAERLDALQNGFLQVVSQSVLAKVEAFEPDLVLAMAQAPLSRQALKRLRGEGVATAMWFVEDFRLFTYWQAFAPLYDIFAVIQKEPFGDKLAEIGQPNALYLPLAADPAFHAPRQLSPVERRKWGADVAFMGAGYPNRRVAFRQLLKYDLKIWGSDWEGDPVLAPRVQLAGRRVAPEECVAIYNATSVNLNLHSSIQAEELVPPGDFVNPRTFELAACGAFQLVDKRSLMGELFAPDELATFGNLEELNAKIGHFLAHPEEREAYARRARERVLAEHTYARRMQALIDFAAARLPGWPRRAPAAEDLMPEFPPELRREAAKLLEELRLPVDTSFDDLVAAVRERQGVLTPLETTLLFVDEWRKQYGLPEARP